MLHDLGFNSNDKDVLHIMHSLIVQSKYVDYDQYLQISSVDNQKKEILKLIEKIMLERDKKIDEKKMKTISHQLQFLDSKMAKVATLTDGMCFGEAALITTEPRNATIKCLTDCYLGTLSKESYDQTIYKY